VFVCVCVRARVCVFVMRRLEAGDCLINVTTHEHTTVVSASSSSLRQSLEFRFRV